MINISNFQIICTLFFICAMYSAFLDSILENMLLKHNGRQWFFMTSALPTFSDVLVMFCLQYFSICLKSRLVIAILCGMIGILFMQLDHIWSIIVGRCICGIMFGMYPVLCILLHSNDNEMVFQKSFPKFTAIGLSGYLVPCVYFNFQKETNLFPVFICNGCVCILAFYLIMKKLHFGNCVDSSSSQMENLNYPHEKKFKQYIFIVQHVFNITASSLFYLISPLCTNMGLGIENISLLIALAIGSQILLSLWIHYHIRFHHLQSILDLNYKAIKSYCIGLIIFFTFLQTQNIQDWINQIFVFIMMMLLLSGVSLFMITSNLLCSELSENQNIMMYYIGMIASYSYVFGPMMNYLFFVHISLPFLCLGIFWMMTWIMHEWFCLQKNFIISF